MKPMSWFEFISSMYIDCWYLFSSIQRDMIRRDYENYLFTGKVVDRNESW